MITKSKTEFENNSRKIRVYADMDGTIARFYEHANCLEMMYSPRFFRKLNPYKNVIEGLKMLQNADEMDVEIHILSAVHISVKSQTIEEKRDWLREHCDFIPEDRFIFVDVGDDKPSAVKKIYGELSASDILLDDYNKNLREWQNAGGSSVKMVNEINDKGTYGPLWSGNRIRYDFSAERICEDFKTIIINNN